MWNSNSSGNKPNKTPFLHFSSLCSNSVSLSITSRAVNTTDDMFRSLLSMFRCFCAGQQSFILTCVGVTCTLRRQRRTCRVDWMVSVECAPSGHYSRICLDRGGRILGEQNCECQEENAELASSLTPDLLSSGVETVTSSSLLLSLQQLSVGD